MLNTVIKKDLEQVQFIESMCPELLFQISEYMEQSKF